MAKKYRPEDTNTMSYAEYDKALKNLIRKIACYFKKKKINIDIIAPILRSGGVPGLMLAVHFEVIKILPLQFKHFYNPKEIKQVIEIPKFLVDIPKNTNILMVENNTVTGKTAKRSIQAIKKVFPKAKIFYATTIKAFGGPEKFDGIEEYFWGIQSNEMDLASPEEIEIFKLRPKITIAPWEDIDYELRAINDWED